VEVQYPKFLEARSLDTIGAAVMVTKTATAVTYTVRPV
jgi:hypothetical protein